MKSIFTYSTKFLMFLILSFLSFSTVVAQITVPPLSTSCTSKDLELVAAKLTGGIGCDTCDPLNPTIMRTLTLSINNTTGSIRTSFAFWGTLEIYSGLNGTLLSSTTITGCGGPLPPNTITPLDFDQISYTCGDILKISNLFLAWTSASPGAICPLDPLDISPKCGTLPSITIDSGVNGEFELTHSECSTPTGAIDLTPTGGTAPYTYLWTTLDGVIPSGQQNDQDLTGIPAGTYSVKITDLNGCITTKTRTITATVPIVAAFTPVTNIIVACGSATTSSLSYTNNSTTACLISGSVTSSLSAQSPAGPCGGSITESWTFTDTYGRTINASRTITVSPAALPTMKAPGNITVACGTVPAPSTVAFSNGLSGGCLISGTSNPSTFSSTPNSCGGTVTETWTATDVCGRTVASVSRTITVSPAALPTMTAPGNITVTCGALPAPSTIAFSNGLSGGCLISGTSNPSTFSSTPNSCGGTVTETWTATDVCGRTVASVSRTITVSPAALPTMTAPGNITVTCGALPAPSTIAFSNGLSGDCLISGTSNPSTFTTTVSGYCNGNVIETWTTSDSCGRTVASVSRAITIDDITPPTFTAPQDITIYTNDSCEYDASVSATGDVINEADNCSTEIQATFTDEVEKGICKGSLNITRTWSLVDICGNKAVNQIQMITVSDNTPPEILSCAKDQTIASDSNCKALVPDFTFDITTSDNCTPTESLIITQLPVAGTEISSGSTTVTVTIEDACGNETTCEVNLIVTNYIVANDDAGSAVNGFTGGTTFTNVLANDLLNCKGVSLENVTLTTISSTNDGVTLSGTNVIVAPGTPAGDYTLTYQICEISNPTNCDQADVTVTVYIPSISITKDGTYTDANEDGITNVGDIITYNFLVTNTGSSTLTNIIVTDPLVTVVGGPIPTLEVDASDSTTFTATYIISQADIDTGFVYNLATATGTPPSGPDVTQTSSDPTPCTTCPVNEQCPDCTITPLTQTPSIAITKDGTYQDTNEDGITNVGDNVIYNFVVTNTGNVTLTNVTVADSNADVSGGPIVTLAVGASDSSTFTAIHTITQEDIDAALVYNLSTVTGTPPIGENVKNTSTDPTPCTNCPVNEECRDCTITILNQSPSISITKDGTYQDTNNDGITNIGDKVIYIFVVTNTGNVTLTNITVTDINADVSGGPIASLAVGASDSNTFTAIHAITQEDIDASLVYNLATAIGTPPIGENVIATSTDPTPCTTCPVNEQCPDCTITILNQNPKIALVKTAVVGETGAVGDVITYTFTVTNIGNVTITNIIITDPLIGLTITNSPIISLAPGATNSSVKGTYIITQADIDLGRVTNSALAVGQDPKGNDVKDISGTTVENDTPTITTLTQNPGLTVIKTSNTPYYSSVGDIINYTIQVKNTGNVTLHQITVKDPLTGLDIIIDLLTPGSTKEYTQNYTVTQNDRVVGSVTNVATADGFTPNETPINASDTEVVEAAIVLGCGSITVHNAFSPNGDGINELFIIDNIDDVLCFPDNTVEIYNRWGILVFETKGYNNVTRVFRGISEGRTTISQSSGLPTGTYYYILSYTSITGTDQVQTSKKDGYLYLTR